jgi:sensor c-di-GMP phosphodiesterase-like protein
MIYSEREIYSGLLNHEFFLEYLPVVSLSTGQCIGAEALIRWRQDDRVVPPMEFIPNIEGTELLGFITYWVIDMVAEEFGQWLRQTSGAYISVNVPPELFGRGGLLYAAYKSNALDVANKIVIEITERGVPDKLGIESINNRYGNVLFALDDVLSHEADILILGRLSIDIIKVDKSFTDRILQKDWPTVDDERFLRLMKELRFTVIAEGIEQRRQADILRDAGIAFGQGWYFSRPLSAEKFKKYFLDHAKPS